MVRREDLDVLAVGAAPEYHDARARSSTENLIKALVKVRAQGYAISKGESVAGASAIAKPILDAEDYVVGAINITGSMDRWPVKRMMEFLPDFESSIGTIETLIGRAGIASEQQMRENLK